MLIRIEGLQAKGRPRFARRGNHVSTYTPKNTAEYEAKIRQMYYISQNRESWFDKEPIEVTVAAYKKIPTGASKKEKRRIQAQGIRPITKPDVDNYLKLALDALNGVAYGDDNQVVRATAEKRFSDGEAYMTIEICEAEPSIKQPTNTHEKSKEGQEDEGKD